MSSRVPGVQASDADPLVRALQPTQGALELLLPAGKRSLELGDGRVPVDQLEVRAVDPVRIGNVPLGPSRLQRGRDFGLALESPLQILRQAPELIRLDRLEEGTHDGRRFPLAIRFGVQIDVRQELAAKRGRGSGLPCLRRGRPAQKLLDPVRLGGHAAAARGAAATRS